MLLEDQVVAKYNPEQNEVEIFGVKGVKPRDSDMTCLANMLNELVDEMVRRGYDQGCSVLQFKRLGSRKASPDGG
jgi:hypothetical protein